MSFFKEQGRDFLSGWMEEALHSFQPARGDKRGFICKPPGRIVLLVKKQGTPLTPPDIVPWISDLIWSLTFGPRTAPDLLDLIFDPRPIFTISTYFALEPAVMNIKIELLCTIMWR